LSPVSVGEQAAVHGSQALEALAREAVVRLACAYMMTVETS
jgi:hypothetical protein